MKYNPELVAAVLKAVSEPPAATFTNCEDMMAWLEDSTVDDVSEFNADELLEIEFHPECRINTDEDVVMAQVAANIRLGLPQARPYGENPNTIVLVCGGPSLSQTMPELREAIAAGGKVVALNGAYQWCLDNDIRPSAVVVLDARQPSARFVITPVEQCHYLLASQCHPDAFEHCRGRQVTIWHACSVGEPEVDMLSEYYFKHFNPVTMGTTVGMRAISLFRMLGYKKFEIFGLDSCYLDDAHHGYAQTENDNEPTLVVWSKPEGRDDLAQRFVCSAFMAKQAQDFLDLIKERGDLFELNVHGPGLIATMLRTGSQVEIEGE